MLSRRSLLRAIPALLAAPAIVRASSLMPVSRLYPDMAGVLTEWRGMRFVDTASAPLWGDAVVVSDVDETSARYTATYFQRAPLPFVSLYEPDTPEDRARLIIVQRHFESLLSAGDPLTLPT